MKFFLVLLILVGFASIAYAESPPIIITQVELWGPESFHIDNVNACGFGTTSLGPWSVGWIELYNTQNKTMTISDVVLKANSWDMGFQPITLEPNQYCYIGTQDKLSTRVGPGGSLGNDPPPHKDEITTLKYSEQKIQYAFSTISLTDDYADTRTWQLVDGKWIFSEANIKAVTTKIRLDSPLKQIKAGTKYNNVQCNEGLVLSQRGHHEKSACVTLFTKIEMIIRGWADDDRLLLGCIGERVQKCYPDDPQERRKALYHYYFGSDELLPTSHDLNISKLHTYNACSEKPHICYGEFDNGTRVRIQCDYPTHGCQVKSFEGE